MRLINNPILEHLNKSQKMMVMVFRKLEKRLENILYAFFRYPISPLQDWFLKVIEDPICCNSLGLPMAENISSQIHLALASESGFSIEMKRQISHRLYDIFKVMYYIFQHPLCPRTLEPYKPYIDELCKHLEEEGYCDTEPIFEFNDKKELIFYKDEFIKSWKFNNWEKYHFTYTPEPMWLNPNLLYLNYPHAFGKTARVFEDVNILENFTKGLNEQLSGNLWGDLFIDFSKLLWCIDTYMINLENLTDEKNFSIFEELIKFFIDKKIEKASGFKSPYLIDPMYKKKMPIPETYYTEDRILFFSAGWALELNLLLDLVNNDKINGIYKKELHEKFIEIANKGIDEIVKLKIPNHLYLLCQRVWFLIECWYYKSILIAKKYKDKAIKKDEDYYEYKDKGYAKTFFDEVLKVEDTEGENNKLKVILENNNDIINQPVFLLGGAGIGKTAFVMETIPLILKKNKNFSMGKHFRVTPVEIHIPDNFFQKIERKVDKKCKKTSILFFDEMHLKSPLSPFALMLDPLQERSLNGQYLGKEGNIVGNKTYKKPWKIIYFFASSAFRSREEFLAFAREKGDISMRDFATRVHHWVEIPDLWQLPEQKFILGYIICKKRKNNEDEIKKKAACITINGNLRSSREIVSELDKTYDKTYEYSKIYEKNLRGNIMKFFE